MNQQMTRIGKDSEFDGLGLSWFDGDKALSKVLPGEHKEKEEEEEEDRGCL